MLNRDGLGGPSFEDEIARLRQEQACYSSYPLNRPGMDLLINVRRMTRLHAEYTATLSLARIRSLRLLRNHAFGNPVKYQLFVSANLYDPIRHVFLCFGHLVRTVEIDFKFNGLRFPDTKIHQSAPQPNAR